MSCEIVEPAQWLPAMMRPEFTQRLAQSV